VKPGFTVCKSAVSLVRKPDAGKLHVRFDERDLETEAMVRYSDTDIPKGLETVTVVSASLCVSRFSFS
jgi:hypothetical protein